jgi:hypothetical protein
MRVACPQAMALAVEREKPAALKLINKAIPHIFGHPTSIFVTAPVKNILFEGIPLYCNVTDFSAKAICSEIRKKDKDFLKLGEDIFGFSFFGIVSLLFYVMNSTKYKIYSI